MPDIKEYTYKNIKLYAGDAREIISSMNGFSAIITDPVWPNAPAGMFPEVDDPYLVFAQTAKFFPEVAKRSIIQIGCDSDPRILNGIPKDLKFFRHINLEYVVPSRKGRILYTHDCAYAYGEPPKSVLGKRLIPGRYLQRDPKNKNPKWHPCPRQINHVRYLIRWFAENGPVLDPFAGSGTTLLAALMAGIPATGIEIKKEYAEKIIKRLQQYDLQLKVFDLKKI